MTAPARRRRSLALLLAAGLGGAPAGARAQEAAGGGGDDWFGRDKALHFGASFAIAGGGYAGASLVSDDRRVRLATGGALAVAAGVGKELWDLSGHGDASWRDLTWDAAGTLAGLGVALALDWVISRAARPRTQPQAMRTAR